MKKFVYITLIGFIGSILLFSCSKQNKEYLLGEWILLTRPVKDKDYRWFFKDSKVYIMAIDGNDNEPLTGEMDTCNFGPYVLKNGVLSIALKQGYCAQLTYEGDWDIQSISQSYLNIRLQTDNGSIWYEFEKAKKE